MDRPTETHRPSVADIVALMRDYSVETTPNSAAKVARFAEHLAPGNTCYGTFLRGSEPADTLEVARRLRA